jgi:hypothetical protein
MEVPQTFEALRDSFPPIDFALGYGSAVFPQKGYNPEVRYPCGYFFKNKGTTNVGLYHFSKECGAMA